MLSFIESLPIGNGVKVIWSPPVGTERTVLLRKLTDDFTGHDDAGAFKAYDGDEAYAFDTQTLVNGQTYFYKLYYFDGAAWSDVVSVSVFVEATAGTLGPDPQSLMIARLSDGLRVECEAGNLVHRKQKIPVFSAPPTFDGTEFPIVTVHLRDDSETTGFIGNQFSTHEFDDDDNVWDDGDATLSGVTLDVIGWSTNADHRIALRKAIKKIILGNDAVFANAGMVNISKSFSDVDDMETYNAPMYQTICRFRCEAPFVVTRKESVIEDVTVIVETINAQAQ